MRLAVTHQTDSEQRVIPLKFEHITSDKLLVTAPAGNTPGTVTTRGYYMVFILNELGVPSEAKFIRLG